MNIEICFSELLSTVCPIMPQQLIMTLTGLQENPFLVPKTSISTGEKWTFVLPDLIFFSFSATSSMIQSTMTVRLSRLLSECSSTLISSTSSLYLTKWVEYFLHTFQIFSVCQVVCRWALSVKKNYRPVKYHNWRHALNVCQTMFTMLKTGKVRKTKLNLTTPHLPTMQISFIICCLCLFSIYFEGISDKNGTHVSIFIMIIDGSIYGWPGGVWFTGGLSLSWSGPQGHQ